MSKNFIFKKEGNIEKVFFKGNNKYMGDIIQDVDGDYYYWPELHGGCWAGYAMMEIAIHLAILNSHEDEESPCHK